MACVTGSSRLTTARGPPIVATATGARLCRGRSRCTRVGRNALLPDGLRTSVVHSGIREWPRQRWLQDRKAVQSFYQETHNEFCLTVLGPLSSHAPLANDPCYRLQIATRPLALKNVRCHKNKRTAMPMVLFWSLPNTSRFVPTCGVDWIGFLFPSVRKSRLTELEQWLAWKTLLQQSTAAGIA